MRQRWYYPDAAHTRAGVLCIQLAQANTYNQHVLGVLVNPEEFPKGQQ